MNRKQKIIVSITGIFIVLLALVGLTYAYFLTRITGNENDKSISVTTANLELVYEEDDDEYVIGEDEIIEPGKTFETKTFTVTNNGNESVDEYAVILEEVSVTYATTTTTVTEGTVTTLGSTTEGKDNDFTLVITCKNQDNETCNGYNAELLEESGILLTNSIEVGETQTYTATLTYNETGYNQSADMNKRYNGKFNIIDTKDTIDLKGLVANYSAGDYIQTNSTKRVSVIYPDKTYKIMGLEAGTHKIKVCAKSVTDCTDDKAKMIETIIIKKGENASVDNTTKTITITDASRLANVNVDGTNGVTINNEIKEYNPFNEGTLAYNIYKNAKDGSTGTKLGEPKKPVGTASVTLTDKQKKVAVPINYFDFDYGTPDGDMFTISSPTSCDQIEILRSNNVEGVMNYVNGDYEFTDEDGITHSLENGSSIDTDYICKDGKITFDTSVTVFENEKTLAMTQDDEGVSFYYRGDVIDNYVDFAGMCWKAVRIEGDGAVKLVLLDQSTTCETATENWDLGTVDYGRKNKTDNGNNYEIPGYLNGDLRKKLVNWYNTNPKFTTVLKEKVKNDTWCLGNLTTVSVDNYAKSFECETSGKQEEKDKNYIGALTINEVVHAGYSLGGINHGYLYVTGDYYTLSPMDLLSYGTDYFGRLYAVTSNTNSGYDGNHNGIIASELGVNSNGSRPAITIKKDILLDSTSGNGLKESPYVIN